MSEDNKTIQEALFEVQRKANEKRKKHVVEMYKSLEEAVATTTIVGGKKQSTTGIPKKPAVNQNTPGSKPPSTSGVETAANIGSLAASVPKRALGGAMVGAAASELGKEVAFGSKTARDVGHKLYDFEIGGVKPFAAASDAMLKAREALGVPSTAPKQYQRDSSSLDKPTSSISPAPKSDKPTSSISPAPKPSPKKDDISFSQAFKKARETSGGSTGQFSWHGKEYQTNIKGSGTAEKPQEKYIAPSTQTKTGINVLKPVATEDGKKKKMSEETNPLIAAFLKLQTENPSNMFEAAKKAKKDYDKDGKIESPKDEVWGSRFRAAKMAGKMEEGMIDPKDPSVQGGGDVTSTPEKPAKPVAPKKVDRDPSYQGSGEVTKSGKPVSVREDEHVEEVQFSQAEIDHINSFFEAVAPNRPEPTKGVNPTVSNTSLTDETIEEGRPKKNPEPASTDRDPRKHIQVEAGRAAAGSVVDFHHNDGSKSKITPAMGRRITSHLQGLKPAERQAAVNKMHASAEGLKV